MNLKSFFLACLFAVTFAVSSPSIQSVSNSVIENFSNCDSDGYTYVRVYDEFGMPWIYVYDDKGNLIYYYPEV